MFPLFFYRVFVMQAADELSGANNERECTMMLCGLSIAFRDCCVGTSTRQSRGTEGA